MKTLLKNFAPLLLAGLLLLPAAGCAGGSEDAPAEDAATDAVDTLTTALPLQVRTRLRPTQGNETLGLVTFAETAGGVEVSATIRFLSEGEHGIHIHETGDCSAPDAASAGGHYNPDGSPHGAPDNPAGQRHAGDLGNLVAPANGAARYQRVDSVITLSGPNSIIGKAVIVHSGSDDFTSQPSGAAGSRIACGIIGQDEGN